MTIGPPDLRAGEGRKPEIDTVAVILAGGRSSRMGGPLPKTLLDLGGRPVVAHVIARLRSQVAALVLSTNEPALHGCFGLPCLRDRIEGFAGPLAGLDAAGRHFSETLGTAFNLVCVAGDTPFLPTDLVARLLEGFDRGRVTLASWGGRTHPAVALWPSELLADLPLDPSMPNRSRSLGAVMDRVGRQVVDFGPIPGAPRIDPFLNVNTPDDLAVARAVVKMTG